MTRPPGRANVGGMDTDLDASTFDKLATATLERIVAAFDDVDPDEVEAVPGLGTVKLDFQGRRRPWVVNSQSAARQMWLAAEQRAWHFAWDAARSQWVAPKTGEELYATLSGLLAEHAGLSVAGLAG